MTRFDEEDSGLQDNETEFDFQKIIGLREELTRWRFSFSNELIMRDQFEILLRDRGVPYSRETRLSPRNRLDFLLWGCVAVEAKVGGGMTGHLRQLKRYADEPGVQATVLLGTVTYALPAMLSGKPCFSLKVQTMA